MQMIKYPQGTLTVLDKPEEITERLFITPQSLNEWHVTFNEITPEDNGIVQIKEAVEVYLPHTGLTKKPQKKYLFLERQFIDGKEVLSYTTLFGNTTNFSYWASKEANDMFLEYYKTRRNDTGVEKVLRNITEGTILYYQTGDDVTQHIVRRVELMMLSALTVRVITNLGSILEVKHVTDDGRLYSDAIRETKIMPYFFLNPDLAKVKVLKSLKKRINQSKKTTLNLVNKYLQLQRKEFKANSITSTTHG